MSDLEQVLAGLQGVDIGSLKKILNKQDVLSWMYEHWTVRDSDSDTGRGPYSLKGHSFQEEIITHKAQESYVMKAAQLGISEIELAHSVHFAEHFGNVIYLFPTSTHIGEFSQARLQPVIEASKYLSSLVSDKTPAKISDNYEDDMESKKRMVDRVSLKAIGKHFFYLRGSQTGAQLKSVDGDKLVIDEYDEMNQKNVPLAKARVDHSKFKIIRGMSTPTYPEYGIHKEFLAGDQRYYFIKCPHCNERQALTWWDNINAEISTEFRICRKCKKPLDHTAKGEWIPTYTDRDIRTYHISQLYSDRVSTKYLIDFAKDPRNEQELWNSKLGLPFTPEGGQITRDQVLARIAEYDIPTSGFECTMGVDIGRDINYIISRTRSDNMKPIIKAGTVKSFEELDFFMEQYGIYYCVVDANPETRKAREFALRFKGRVWLAYYVSMKGYFKLTEDPEYGVPLVHIERTTSLDYSLGRFHNNTVTIPGKRISTGAYTFLPDDDYNSFIDQICAPVRVLEKDPRGNEVAKYIEGTKADHYAHANNYDDVAQEISKSKSFGEVGAVICG